MAISSYSKNGVQLFRVCVQARGKNDYSLRLQKSKNNISTIQDARREEKKLLALVVEEVAKTEGRGLCWGDIVDRWEIKARSGDLGDKFLDRLALQNHISRLRRYTSQWWTRRASDLTKGDGRQVLIAAKNLEIKKSTLRKIKSSINSVFNWAIEEKLVVGLSSSPVEGLSFNDKIKTVPKILNLEEVRLLLAESQARNHDWYPIWAFAVLTGMRSGELLGLQWKDIDLDKKIITVSKSYKAKSKVLKSTKAGYWRCVPISKDLEGIILALKSDFKIEPETFVLPRIYAWLNGQAGVVLKNFLSEIGLKKDVVFHTLRACFATHMLAAGVDQAKVMKIGGWADLKTFQIYVRLAGVDVKDATEALDVMPKLHKDNVVNISQF